MSMELPTRTSGAMTLAMAVTGAYAAGVNNSELQYYTSTNAVVANGILRITAKKESLGGKEYTSARMVTRGLQERYLASTLDAA